MSDLVKRQDVYDLIIKTFKDEENLYKAGVLATGVNLLPAVEAEPVVHGEWIWKPEDERTKILTCSVCASDKGANELYNYCPNCGAKMDGGVSDD